MNNELTPLKSYVQWKKAYDEAREDTEGLPEWEDLSEASRREWLIIMMMTAAMRAEVWR